MPETAGWAVGDRVLGQYEVLRVHRHGGMGLVHRVRHLGWNLDLAVKSPRPELFADDADRERFVREAETWVSLGMHPHLCTCHYVRTLDGIPRVFAEYVDGGSLREWIDDGRLYRDGPRESLARILDIAVQTAWGMAHAHGRGVVHQDLKPANVLLDGAGTAKVTDFGLARSGGLASGRRPGRPGDASVLVTVGGMTPAYASPEQLSGGRVSRRTDVWSLAVTVLEMFTGKVTWLVGPAAGDALAECRARGPADPRRPPMPPRLADLLRRCLSDDPADRPDGMAELSHEIAEIYRQECGHAYPRAAPRTADSRADELTNRALSMLDLGRVEEAERYFDEALAADPQHVGATYNGGLLRWRTGRISDDVFVARLEAVRAHATASWPVRRLLAQVHLERGDAEAALPLLEEEAERPKELSRQVLEGHAGRVNAVAVTADGSRGLSAGEDGTVRLWDLTTGRCLRVLDDHTGRVNALAVTADGTRALSAGDDGTVRLWDLATGRCLRVLEGHTWRVTSAALSADGFHALSGCDGGTLRLWDLTSGHCLRVIDGHHGGVDSVAMSVDRRFALAGGSGEVRIWELATGRRLGTLAGGPHGVARLGGMAYSSAVPSVMVGDDGRLALTVDDRVVRVWDLATGRCVRVFDGHADWVHSAAATPDGRLAVSAGVDATVRVWEPASARCVRTFAGHQGIVRSVAVSADRSIALSGGADGTVRVWELPDVDFRACSFHPCRPRSHTELVGNEARLGELLDAAETSTGEAALALLRQAREMPGYERDPRVLAAWRKLSLVSARTGVRDVWQSRVLETHPSAVFSVAAGADGRFALSGGGGTARLWEPATGRRLHTLQGHAIGLGHGCVVIADRRSPGSGQGEGTMRVLEPATGRCLHTLDGHTPRWATLSADGHSVVSGGTDGTVRVWELATGRCVQALPGADDPGPGFLFTLQGHTYGGVVSSIAALTDGRSVVSGGDHGDGRLRVWDLATGKCLRTFQGHHSGAVKAIAATPDGRLVLSGGGHGDAAVRVWDPATGRCLHTLQGHTGSVNAVAVTADGSLGFSGGDDGSVRVWDPATGRCLHTLEGHAGRVRAVAVSADGNHALSGGADGTVREWEIDWELEATTQTARHR